MSPVMMAAVLVGLRVKKETIGEITAAAQVMREYATKVEVKDRTHLVDIVGTGGDGSHTFNISTCAMFVAAACGARVSKHGGRSVSSKSGSADVLEALGLSLALTPEAIAGLDRGDRHRLHVRAEPPPGDEERRRRAPRARRADHLQHPRPADQPGRCAQHPDGRLPFRSRRHPGAGTAAPRRRACRRRLRQGRDGRDLARRRDPCRRAEGRRDPRVTRSIRKTSASRWRATVPCASRRRRRRRWRCWNRCWATSPARHATSSSSTPARRSMRPTWRRASRRGVALAAGAIADGRAKAKLREFIAFPARRRRRRDAMSDILKQIVEVKRDEVSRGRRHRSLVSIRGDAERRSAASAISSGRCAARSPRAACRSSPR